MADRRVIVCNYREGTKIAPAGAKAWVHLLNPGNAHEQIQVLARSRSGRLVLKWESIRRLGSFRLSTVPPEHPRYTDERLWDGTEPEIEALNAAAARSEEAKP